ncbi:MAG: amidase [Solirubrobacteraceae bacterium]|nr:amidase [Solirubrobacteraceae bacterium]
MEELRGLAGRLATGELSATEVARRTLERIRDAAALGAFAAVDEEAVLAQAAACDARPAQGPLHGVPIAVKDNIDVAGLPTRAGSRALPDAPAQADAEVVARLRAAGAVIVGKLAMHELALGVISPGVGNPRLPGRVAGGSSGGSGAAVTAGLCAGALGTDTGGSVRVPAAFCGCAGLRPTTGAVPSDGVLPLSWSHDTVGPLAPTVADVALLQAVIAGWERVPTTPGGPGRLALWTGDPHPVDPAVAEAFAAAVAALRAAGFEVVERPAPDLGAVADLQIRIAGPEAAASTATHLGVEPGTPAFEAATEALAPDVRAIVRADPGSAADHVRAVRVEAPVVAARLEAELEDVDAILTPVAPAPPPPVGVGEWMEIAGERRPTFFALTRYATIASVAGAPALAIPGPRPGIGVQLIGRPGADAGLLGLGLAVEAAVRAAAGGG